jgi:hypothetical protein
MSLNRIRRELKTLRQSLPDVDDGYCHCSDEQFHTTRDENDVVCPTCNRPYARVIVETIVESREELEAFNERQR